MKSYKIYYYMAQGCNGKFYVGFDDCLPFGIKEL